MEAAGRSVSRLIGPKLILAACLVVASLLASSVEAGAATKIADSDFGVDGLVRVDPESDSTNWPVGVAETTGGKIVVGFTRDGRSGAIAQLDRKGQADQAFGTNGISPLDFASGSLRPNDVIVDRSNRVLVAGQTMSGSDEILGGGVVRLLPNGRPDPNFSRDGLSTSKLTVGFNPKEIALAPGGKIVAVGPTSGQRDVWTMIVRYLPNGELDRSFSGDGVARIVAPHLKLMTTVAVDRKGRVVVGGTSKGGGAKPPAFELARYKANGRLDPSFSRDGWARFNPNGPESKSVVVVRIDDRGRIVAAGGDGDDTSVIRVKTSGYLDRSFGKRGAVKLPGFSSNDATFDRQGRLVVAGNMNIAFGDPQADVATLDRKGRIVPIHFTVSSEFRSFYSSALGRQGRILIAGSLRSGSTGVLRFLDS